MFWLDNPNISYNVNGAHGIINVACGGVIWGEAEAGPSYPLLDEESKLEEDFIQLFSNIVSSNF